MSNFSRTYQCYLQGYIGDIKESTFSISQRQMQALALGVHHQTTGKAPLLHSVEVTAALRRLSATPEKVAPTLCGDVVLVATGPNKISAIKVVREICHLGLKEAKDLVDGVTGPASYGADGRHTGYLGGKPVTLIHGKPDRAESAARALREVGCTVEVK